MIAIKNNFNKLIFIFMICLFFFSKTSYASNSSSDNQIIEEISEDKDLKYVIENPDKLLDEIGKNKDRKFNVAVSDAKTQIEKSPLDAIIEFKDFILSAIKDSWINLLVIAILGSILIIKKQFTRKKNEKD